jgi:hypothetical protein
VRQLISKTDGVKANYYLGPWQEWRNDDNLLVLSNGDALGVSYHADFFNGVSHSLSLRTTSNGSIKWDQDVLSDAIEQCGNGKSVGTNLAACAPFKPSFNQTASWQCRLESQIPDE